MKSQKLENLEKRFGLAEQLMEELDGVIENIGLDLQPEEIMLPTTPDQSIMNMGLLAQDFMMARNNIMKLISTGQKILDSASVLDIGDLKASQLEALSNLQTTIGNNIKLLMDIYKDIAAIEKTRQKPVTKTETNPAQVSNTVNQNLFVGSSSDLLKLINDNTLSDFSGIKEVN
jgi:hypothetical protein